MLALALDPSVALGSLGVLIPFISDVRQPWTDLGIISAWGMIVLTLSYAVRHYTGKHGWRILHYSAFPLWMIALMHGIGAGSDSRQFWAIGMYVVTSASVVFLTMYRILRIGRRGAGATRHPSFVHDRAVMHRQIASYRKRCASLSSKTKSSSRT
jgi:predicted ferric reductase